MEIKMKVIGVIPARYKSSRFPGKPLADIMGKPMIWWVYHQCRKVHEFDEVYVATDDSRIESVCRQYRMNVILTSEKHQTGTDRVAEVSERVEGDFFVNIQGDEPLIAPESIRAVIRAHIADPTDAVINTMSIIEDEEELHKDSIVKVAFNDRGYIIYLSRSLVPCKKDKGEEVTYYRHLGLYGLSREALRYYANAERGRIEKIEDIEMFRFIENNIPIKIILVKSKSIGVDCPGDIKKVCGYLENLHEQ